MAKYRIKEYKGKFTVEEREFEEPQRDEIQNWVAWIRTGILIKYDTLQEAKAVIDHDIIMSQEPKYHYYPEETK